ncbi:MAG: hypothetical protein ACRD3T_18005 [Terriglobia bacterium]
MAKSSERGWNRLTPATLFAALIVAGLLIFTPSLRSPASFSRGYGTAKRPAQPSPAVAAREPSVRTPSRVGSASVPPVPPLQAGGGLASYLAAQVRACGACRERKQLLPGADPTCTENTFCNINNIRLVDGIAFTTINAAVADLKGPGIVISNLPENFTSEPLCINGGTGITCNHGTWATGIRLILGKGVWTTQLAVVVTNGSQIEGSGRDMTGNPAAGSGSQELHFTQLGAAVSTGRCQSPPTGR